MVPALLLLVASLLVGCQTAEVTSQQTLAPAPAAKPTVIYVADFALGAQDIQHQGGLLSGRPGPVGKVGDRLSGVSSDPAARARQLVNLLSDSMVKELTRNGLNARRLSPDAALPGQGWLVHGFFAQVQEGNRLQRAVIGFGEGQTDLQVVATINDLSLGKPQPLYEVATDASSGKKPGAAPTLAFGPWGAAAHYVMAGSDLEKNVKQTAAQIASQVAQRVQPPQ